MSLQEILPQPRRMPVGGEPCQVWPLTLSALAALESWAAARRPAAVTGPIRALRGEPAGPGRDRLLRATWLAIEGARARSTYGEAAFLEELWTPEGRMVLLAAALAPGRADLPAAELARLAAALDDSELDDLLRFCLAFEPLDELVEFLDGPTAGPGGDPPTWARVYHDLAEGRPWLTPAAFGALTIGQLRALRSAGRRSPGACRHPKGSRAWWDAAARRAAFFADPEPETEDHAGPEPAEDA